MKGKKIIVSALVASMVGAPVAVLSATSSALADNSPLTNENDEYTVVGPSVKVNNNYSTTAKKGDIVKVPYPQVEDGDIKTVVTVIDPYGNVLEEGSKDEGKIYEGAEEPLDPNNEQGTKVKMKYFVAGVEGTYTFRIESYKEIGGKRTSIVSAYELFCEVSGDSGSLEMPENSYFVVPTEFVKGKTLTVPVPDAYVNDEDVSFDTNATYEMTSGQFAKLKAFLVKSGSSTPIEMTYVAGTGSSAEKKAHFTYTFNNDDLTVGTYKLVYKLYLVGSADTDVLEKDTSGNYKIKPIYVSNSKTIKVKSSLANNSLFISWASTPKKTAEVGTSYSLVDVNASFVEGSTDYEDVYTEITVTHNESGEKMTVNYDDMTFVPTKKGNYFVTYKAHIPSLEISSNILSYSITNVDDSTDPVLYLTGDYEIANGKAYTNVEITDCYVEGDKAYTDSSKATELTDYFVEGNKAYRKTDLTGKEKADVIELIGDESYNVLSYYNLQPIAGDEGNYSVTVRIPAAYVTDNFSDLNGITVTRNLYKRTNITESGKMELLDSDGNVCPYNKVAEFTFTTKVEDGKTNYGAGNYVVRYVFSDESGQSVTKDYNITIKSKADAVSGEPKLTFVYDTERIKKEDTISFSVPTATDSYDTNLLVKTYYGFNEPVISKVNDNEDQISNMDEFKEFVQAKDGKYELDVTQAITDLRANNPTKLYLISIAYNSYDKHLTKNKNVVIKTITIVNGQNDSEAPTYENRWDTNGFNGQLIESNREVIEQENGFNINSVSLNEKGFNTNNEEKAVFNQDNIVTIPEITFRDKDGAVDFAVEVSYTNGDKVVKLSSLESQPSIRTEKESDEFKYYISGASFRVSYAKTYTITISATDSNGNVSFTSFAVRVNDTQPPVISIENNAKFSEDVEVGTEFVIPTPTVYDNDEVVENPNWHWTILVPGAKNPSEMTSYKNTYTPTVTGTYIITYYAKDSAGNENVSSEYRLNVVAEKAPIITVDPLDEAPEWDYSKSTQDAVLIPKASAKDVNFAGAIIVDAPVVKNSKGEEVDVKESADKTMWQFTPDVQGEYTITYSAQGKFLSSTKVLTMTIGDGDAPTMSWENKEEDFKSTVNVGDSWTFKFNMIEVDDDTDDLQAIIDGILKNGVNSTSMNELSSYMTITMKDSNNKTVSYTIADGGLKYTFENSGNYTFKIVLKDKAGNSTGTTYSYTITASEEAEAEEKDNNSVVGTVLIVLSVVILAGVVAYFAITTKQVDSKSKAKKSEKKTDKKDKE